MKEVSLVPFAEFEDALLSPEHLSLLDEAASWNPPGMTCFWRHHLTARNDARAFEALLWCLGANVRHIAASAPLMVWTTCASTEHDGSQALALSMLLVQARSLGLAVMPLEDIYHDRAAAVLNVLDAHDTVSAVAIGYPASSISKHRPSTHNMAPAS